MTNIRAERTALIKAIGAWSRVVSGTPQIVQASLWVEVEHAILDLDNAAYDRGYKKAREEMQLLYH